MRRALTILLLMLLTSCVLHDPSTVNMWKTPPRQGMTRAEIRSTYGYPLRVTRNTIGSSTYETYWYEHSYQVHTMLAPPREHYQSYVIFLKDGVVTGGSW
jgi:hypothetical protein